MVNPCLVSPAAPAAATTNRISEEIRQEIMDQLEQPRTISFVKVGAATGTAAAAAAANWNARLPNWIGKFITYTSTDIQTKLEN